MNDVIMATLANAQNKLRQAKVFQGQAKDDAIKQEIARAKRVLSDAFVNGGFTPELLDAIGVRVEVAERSEEFRVDSEAGPIWISRYDAFGIFGLVDDRGRSVECEIKAKLVEPPRKAKFVEPPRAEVAAVRMPDSWEVSPLNYPGFRPGPVMKEYSLHHPALTRAEALVQLIAEYNEAMDRNRAAIAAGEDRYSREARAAFEQQRRQKQQAQEQAKREAEREEEIARLQSVHDEVWAAIDREVERLSTWPQDTTLTLYHWEWCAGASGDSGEPSFDYDRGWSFSDRFDDDGYIQVCRYGKQRKIKLIPEAHKPVVERLEIGSIRQAEEATLIHNATVEVVGIKQIYSELARCHFLTWGGPEDCWHTTVLAPAAWLEPHLGIPGSYRVRLDGYQMEAPQLSPHEQDILPG